MYRNFSGQKITVYAFDSTTNLPKTADAANLTAYVAKDDGTATILGDTSAVEVSPTNAAGYYTFDLTATETNAFKLHFTVKSSTANIVVLGSPAVVYTRKYALLKNAALAAFTFMMTDSTNHAPATGKTVTVQRRIDSGSFAGGTLSSVTEVGNGLYSLDFAAADLNGDVIVLRATASGCDDRVVTLLTNQ
jgi:hypothetical protein